MNQEFIGATLHASPFITSILSPQLKSHAARLVNATSTEDFLKGTPSFVILEDGIIWEKLLPNIQKVSSFLQNSSVNVVLTFDKAFKRKSELLDIGFTHCFDIPVATELITKTIISALKKQKVPENQSYLSTGPLQIQCLHDGTGNNYMIRGKKTYYLTHAEWGILEYLQRRKGYATRQELAYAGWHSFDIKANTVTVVVRKLRLKIRDGKMPYTISNLYGFGYRLIPLFPHLGSDNEIH